MAQIFAPNSWGSVVGPISEWCRKLAEAIDQLANGQSRTIGTVTLTHDATTTTVLNKFVTPTCLINFMPTTANAAGEIGGGTMYVSARTGNTSFVITHANAVSTDRTFVYEIRVK